MKNFRAGYDFATATGEKTGQNLEDLVEKAELATTGEGGSVADDSTLEVNVSRKLQVKAGGITASHIHSSVVFVPTGAVLPFAGVTAPTGFLVCNGSAISRSTYAALFAVIGVAHGYGDGSTTFNLPDLRGRFIRGVDGATGRDPDAASRVAPATGGNTGDAVGSLQDDEFKAHTHTYVRATDQDEGTETTNKEFTFSDNDTKNTGSAGGSETRPKNVYMNFIIKV